MPTSGLAEGVVLGKYRLLRRMGEGGMAVVFEAEHTRLGQRVAIKVLREEHAIDPVLVERFEREGRAIGKLRSRNIVRVLDVDATPAGAPYLVMELLEGTDLAEELGRRGPLPVAEAVGYVVQACRALAEAHGHGIIHRDIKPSNLFLANEGGSQVLKLLDFGIAKDAPGGDARLTHTEAVMGTPLYMAPEQFRGARDVDARADVWGLGATLYELLAGRPPFQGTAATIGISILTDPVPPLEHARQDVPPAVGAIVSRALEKDRERRFPSARELGDALADFSTGVVIAPRPSASFPAAGPVMGHARTQTAVAARTPTEPRARAKQSTYRRIGLTTVAIAGVLGVAAFIRLSTPQTPAPQAASTEASGAGPSSPPPEIPRQATPPSPPATVSSPSLPPAASSLLPSPVPPARTARPSAHPSASAPPPASSASSAPSSPPLFFPGQ